MGSPPSDDDPTRRVPGPGGWGQGASGPGGPHGPPGGPYYPPPGQGGYRPDQETTRLPQPPEHRDQTARFPQPGGFPPGGPGGPYPPQGPQYGYGGPPPAGPPPDGSRSRKGLVIALVAGLVILAGVAVALVIAFTRDDGETVTADPTGTTSTPPTTSPSASPTETTTSSPSPTDTPGDRTDELLAVLPPDFTDCAETELAGDGDVAAVQCGASSTQPGPQTAFFYLYEDTRTLDQVFVEDIEAEGIEPMPPDADCTSAQGVTTWEVDGVEGGNVACTITDQGLLIAWTDREFGIEAVVLAPGSTQEELAALAQWWRDNSDYRR